MKEYKMAKGWALFVYIFTPLMIVLFIWFALIPFLPGEEMPPGAAWYFVPVGLLMVVLMIYFLLDAIKGRIIIEGNTIIKKGVLGTSVLKRNEIKGFTTTPNFIVVLPGVPYKKKILISVAFEKLPEITAWLASEYTDLDEERGFIESQEIFTNVGYGDTGAERMQKLEKAKQVANLLNIGGLGVGAWAAIYPKLYLYAMLACIVFPLIAIGVVRFYKGLIRIDVPRGSAYPSVAGAIAGPVFGIVWRSLQDYIILEYTNCWLPAIVIAVCLLGLMMAVQKDFNFREARHLWFVAGFLLLNFAYGYGTVLFTNCYFDKSEPQVYTANVQDKKMSTGTTTSYYLYLTPWGKFTDVEKVDVPAYVYNSLEKNDQVQIGVHKGKLGIPWLTITK